MRGPKVSELSELLSGGREGEGELASIAPRFSACCSSLRRGSWTRLVAPLAAATAPRVHALESSDV
jgi:hypothetical protein